MSDFFNKCVEMQTLFTEIDKYKAYILRQTDETVSLTKKEIFSGDNVSLFGVEIFQFWLEAVKVKNEDKSVFLSFADSVGVPVRDRDRGEDGLSWLGRSIYDLWCEAVHS